MRWRPPHPIAERASTSHQFPTPAPSRLVHRPWSPRSRPHRHLRHPPQRRHRLQVESPVPLVPPFRDEIPTITKCPYSSAANRLYCNSFNRTRKTPDKKCKTESCRNLRKTHTIFNTIRTIFVIILQHEHILLAPNSHTFVSQKKCCVHVL